MAKNITGNPWIFDAVAQYEGFLPNISQSTAPVFNIKPYIHHILFEAKDVGGTYEVRDDENGRTITGPITLSANEAFEVDVRKQVDGVYIQLFGTDGQILIYHGVV